MRIVFMGTPGFASYMLNFLVEAGKNIVGVVTAPDRPAGRGRKPKASEVKVLAMAKNLPVLQPEKLKDQDFLTQLKGLNPDVIAVVAFRMLPEKVWQLPPKGTINLHASLLPDYRGAAPINHAIINGDTQSGVTTFLIDEKIDTGKILEQEKIVIEKDHTAGELHDKLMILGAQVLNRTLTKIEEGNIQPVSQSELSNEQMRPAPKIFKEDCRINWDQPAEKVHNFIRGLSPYPSAITTLKMKGVKPLNMKIFLSKPLNKNEDMAPGTLLINHNTLKVACNPGVLEILSLQAEGKKRLKTEDFLRGFNFKPEACFEEH